MLLKIAIFLLIILLLVFGFTSNFFSEKNDVSNQAEYTGEDGNSLANEPIQLQDKGDFKTPLSDHESISDVQDINNNKMLLEESVKQNEESLPSSKAKVSQASTNSDSLTVNELNQDKLKQEVLNHSNPETKNEVSNKAINNLQTSVSGTSATIQESSANDSSATVIKATPEVTKIEIKSQETLPAVDEEQSEFSALQEKAKNALEDGDPHVLHEILKEIANHPDNPDAKAFEGSNLKNPPDEEDF